MSSATGCSAPLEIFTVSESGSPDVTVDVVTEDFADTHVIVATATGTGIYEFSLDQGPWQDSGMFIGVTPGEHTINVRDVNGCGVTAKQVFIVDYPKYFTPNGDGGADSSTSWSATYTGIEGLTLAYGAGEDNSTTTTADATAWSISYAYGPFSASLADLEYDHETATSDRDMSSYYVSYTVSDEISIGYGVEEITDGSGTEDAEFSGYDASYTAGGMTLSVAMSKGDNIDYSTTATKDQERWFLGASFAF